MELLIQLIVFVGLMTLGYVAGSIAEKRHYESIEKREREFLHLPAVTMKDVAFGESQVVRSELVCGSVVISVDYFKRFLASLRNIVGGQVRSYESLLDRGRREAGLRMKGQAPKANIIVNVRLETASIAKNPQKGVTAVEVVAYGTAITLKS